MHLACLNKSTNHDRYYCDYPRDGHHFLSFVKLSDLVTLHIALFMHKFHNKLLPSYFDNFFNPVLSIHNYNTRSAANQSYYLPRARTNYGIFNIRFQGPKVWNSLGKDIKSNPFGEFKKQLKNELMCQY